jgi:hypothetical protein
MLLRHWWFKLGLILIVPLLASSLIGKYTKASWSWGKPVARPGINLLGENEHELKDHASGLDFTLPTDYSVQAQSLALPEDKGDERMIAKCKRDWDGKENGKMPAWLQISVQKVPADQALAELAKKKKPENAVSNLLGGVEDFQVEDNPAVRVRFEMRYHEHDFIREVVAVRKDERVFFVRFEYLKRTRRRCATRCGTPSPPCT